MIDLLGDAGRAALERIAGRRTLYAFDFDGTLAPIVGRPDDARAAPGTIALLQALQALAPVVVVTGRGVEDLRGRIGFEPDHVIGNHGAEGLPGEIGDTHDLGSHRAVVADWVAQWPKAAGVDDEEGVVVEPKTYSLSVHYRHASDPERATRTIETKIAALDPRPRVIGGKCVFNLLPEGAPDKGTALIALARHLRCECAFFIGDDITDEAAFAVAPDDWVTVHVGGASDTRARYFIAAQSDIDCCLQRLVDTLRAKR